MCIRDSNSSARSGLIAPPTVASNTLANQGDLPNFDGAFLGGAGQTGIFDGTSGALQVGEQIVVEYTVRIDAAELTNGPDATTAPTPGNQVQGSANSAGGMVNDDSDAGLDPNSNNGDGTTDDPSPFEVPQIRLFKAHSDAVENADGTSTITVSLRVQNSGTVPVSNLSLTEDIASQFGFAFISVTTPTIDSTLAPTSTIPTSLINPAWAGNTALDVFDAAVTSEVLNAGEEFSITFDVVVDPDFNDDDSDFLTNTATVTGDGQNFDGSTVQVSDQSGLDDGSGIDIDAPTPAIVPEIGVAKFAGDAVPNGDNFDVTFTLFVENTGSVTLDMPTLFDDIDAQFGNAFVGVSGLAVQNFSGSGTAPTANVNWQSDTTLNLLNASGSLNPGDSFQVVFTATIDPDGLDSVSQGLTNQATAGGTAVDAMGNPLTDSSGLPLTAVDASDSGASPQGGNGTASGDMGTSDDPTPIIIADVSAAKQVVGTPTLLANGNFEAVYQVVIENTGTVDLANLTLSEDLAAQYGPAYVNAYNLALTTPPADPTSNIALDTANFNGGTNTEIVNTVIPSVLAVGDSFIFEFSVEIDPVFATSTINNTVTAGGDAVDANGNPLTDSTGAPITATDDSDSGTDPSDQNAGAPGDMGTSDDPTPLLIPQLSDLVTVKTLISADATPAEGDTVTYQIEVINNGAAQATNVSLTDLLPAGLTPTAGNGAVTQGSYDPVTGLFNVGTLNLGDTAILTLEGTVDVGQGGNTITTLPLLPPATSLIRPLLAMILTKRSLSMTLLIWSPLKRLPAPARRLMKATWLPMTLRLQTMVWLKQPMCRLLTCFLLA